MKSIPTFSDFVNESEESKTLVKRLNGGAKGY